MSAPRPMRRGAHSCSHCTSRSRQRHLHEQTGHGALGIDARQNHDRASEPQGVAGYNEISQVAAALEPPRKRLAALLAPAAESSMSTAERYSASLGARSLAQATDDPLSTAGFSAWQAVGLGLGTSTGWSCKHEEEDEAGGRKCKRPGRRPSNSERGGWGP